MKLRTTLVVIGLVLSVRPSFAQNNAINENFDSLPIGALPPGWTLLPSGYAGVSNAASVSAPQSLWMVPPPYNFFCPTPGSPMDVVVPFSSSTGFHLSMRYLASWHQWGMYQGMGVCNYSSPLSYPRQSIYLVGIGTQLGTLLSIDAFPFLISGIGGVLPSSGAWNAWNALTIVFDPSALTIVYDINGASFTVPIPTGSPLLAQAFVAIAFRAFDDGYLDDVQIARFGLNPSSPLGPGSLQLDLVFGPPAGTSFMAATQNAGAYPNGWLFGLDIPFPELGLEIATGAPFLNRLDASGSFTIGPFVGLPSGLHFYAIALGAPPASTIPTVHSAPITYTIP